MDPLLRAIGQLDRILNEVPQEMKGLALHFLNVKHLGQAISREATLLPGFAEMKPTTRVTLDGSRILTEPEK